MTLVSPTQSNPGDEITASKINGPINQIAAVVNGYIDNDNIKASAGISGTKLADSSVSGAKLTGIYAPQGFLQNGYISRTVSSNNITVAIKTLAGADPSASDPVYVRIGNTIRTITAALSVTKNAGTNWFAAGSSELATLEVDYFVYIGYNATDGVTIGFSRLPHARVYGDFSTTSTNDRYAAISTITTAASTDEYENVGRFNATLSASASYNWSVPATSVVVSRPIFNTRWLTWTPTLVGFSANPTNTVYLYKISENMAKISVRQGAAGTSNGTTFTVTPPITPATRSNSQWTATVTVLDNNGSGAGPGRAYIASGSTTITVGVSATSDVWTNVNGKRANFLLDMEI